MRKIPTLIFWKINVMSELNVIWSNNLIGFLNFVSKNEVLSRQKCISNLSYIWWISDRKRNTTLIFLLTLLLIRSPQKIRQAHQSNSDSVENLKKKLMIWIARKKCFKDIYRRKIGGKIQNKSSGYF